MEIVVSNKTSRPLYEQISTQIKSQIMNGELKAGEALPSIRPIAKSLQISVLTVFFLILKINTTCLNQNFLSKRQPEKVVMYQYKIKTSILKNSKRKSRNTLTKPLKLPVQVEYHLINY